MIRNVIFDIGMVLAHFRYREYMQELQFTSEQIEAVTAHMIFNPLWNEFDRAARPFSDVLNEMKAQHPDETDLYDRFWADPTRLCISFPDTREWLLGLKQRGYHLYLLSNYPEDLFQRHWKSTFTFTDLVDGKVISYAEKLTKPEAGIYQVLFDRYHLNPAESIFLDDRAENIEAAGKLGLRGIVVGDREKAKEELEEVLEEGGQNR
ncbi:MAG: HAD family phosphatase [Lachnospiraceae bacterium]|nr:HAD family phosphatase [Lachnospiraceae bacterium]